MNPAAIIMMIVTILLVWGGLVASMVMLRIPTPDADEHQETLASQRAKFRHDRGRCVPSSPFDTLAPSVCASEPMAHQLRTARCVPVCVTSGGEFDSFSHPASGQLLLELKIRILMPTWVDAPLPLG